MLKSQAASSQSRMLPLCTKPAQLNRPSRAGSRAAHIQQLRRQAAGLGGQSLQQRRIDIGGDHLRPLAHAGQRTGAAYALAGRSDQNAFALQSHTNKSFTNAKQVPSKSYR